MITAEQKLLNILFFMREGEVPMCELSQEGEGIYDVFDEKFLAHYRVMVTEDRTYEVYFTHPQTEETLFVGEYDEADNLQWLLDSTEVWERHLPRDMKQLLLAIKESAWECAERLRNGESPEDIGLGLDEDGEPF